ncbi:MAG: DNA starvation/stationary phase protection protein Dps [Cyanobacteria bacterium P01_A01_bin.114]
MYSSQGVPSGRYYPTAVGLTPEVQVEAIEILNQTLASTIDLWMQVKCSRWNVKGMHFFSLYQLFDTLAEQLYRSIDLVGERVVALGGQALEPTQTMLVRSQIPQYPSELCTGKEHVTAMSRHVAVYAACLRNCIEIAEGLGEAGTADLYKEISRTTDQSLWLLEAHLQTCREDSQ